MKYFATVDNQNFEIEINAEGEILLDGRRLELDFRPVSDQPVYSLLIDGQSYQAHVIATEKGSDVLLLGRLYSVAVEDERAKLLRQASGGIAVTSDEFLLKAPMPGLVIDVPVKEEQPVKKGDILVVLESMKMQNELKAPRAGKVTSVRVKPGDSVDLKQALLSVE